MFSHTQFFSTLFDPARCNFSRNLLFGFKNGTDHNPSRLFGTSRLPRAALAVALGKMQEKAYPCASRPARLRLRRPAERLRALGLWGIATAPRGTSCRSVRRERTVGVMRCPDADNPHIPVADIDDCDDDLRSHFAFR